jgi:hypothetical protein
MVLFAGILTPFVGEIDYQIVDSGAPIMMYRQALSSAPLHD